MMETLTLMTLRANTVALDITSTLLDPATQPHTHPCSTTAWTPHCTTRSRSCPSRPLTAPEDTMPAIMVSTNPLPRVNHPSIASRRPWFSPMPAPLMNRCGLLRPDCRPTPNRQRWETPTPTWPLYTPLSGRPGSLITGGPEYPQL